MNELVPFQLKRKKTFPRGTGYEIAVKTELEAFFAKYYSSYFHAQQAIASSKSVVIDTLERTIGQQVVPQTITVAEFSQIISPVTSPALIQKREKWTLSSIEAPVIAIVALSMNLFGTTSTPSKGLSILPKPYAAMVRKVYTSKWVRDELARFLVSKKRATKYLRIFQKRLGIFSTKKPPFHSVWPF